MEEEELLWKTRGIKQVAQAIDEVFQIAFFTVRSIWLKLSPQV
jgi:hypothetical protein